MNTHKSKVAGGQRVGPFIADNISVFRLIEGLSFPVLNLGNSLSRVPQFGVEVVLGVVEIPTVNE